jgi:hypothetical protein
MKRKTKKRNLFSAVNSFPSFVLCDMLLARDLFSQTKHPSLGIDLTTAYTSLSALCHNMAPRPGNGRSRIEMLAQVGMTLHRAAKSLEHYPAVPLTTYFPKPKVEEEFIDEESALQRQQTTLGLANRLYIHAQRCDAWVERYRAVRQTARYER